jgi:iron complex transport system ATP-binding protein
VNDLASLDVGVTAGDAVLVDGLSARFRRGEVSAVLGPNGAGKSTWLTALAGLLRPTHGDVLLSDRPLSALDPAARGRAIGYLAQGREVAWGVDAGTLVGLGRLPYHRSATVSADDRVVIEAAMRDCDVLHLRDRDVLTLSGGERARVLLARVLAGEPDWILADEPLAGLDPAHRLDIARLLRRLASSGRGVIVTLHDLTLAGMVADRVLLLNGGRIVADGPPDAALTCETIARTYGVDVEVLHRSDGRRVIVPVDRTA